VHPTRMSDGLSAAGYGQWQASTGSRRGPRSGPVNFAPRGGGPRRVGGWAPRHPSIVGRPASDRLTPWRPRWGACDRAPQGVAPRHDSGGLTHVMNPTPRCSSRANFCPLCSNSPTARSKFAPPAASRDEQNLSHSAKSPSSHRGPHAGGIYPPTNPLKRCSISSYMTRSHRADGCIRDTPPFFSTPSLCHTYASKYSRRRARRTCGFEAHIYLRVLRRSAGHSTNVVLRPTPRPGGWKNEKVKNPDLKVKVRVLRERMANLDARRVGK
jgi:hypothetical protein